MTSFYNLQPSTIHRTQQSPHHQHHRVTSTVCKLCFYANDNTVPPVNTFHEFQTIDNLNSELQQFDYIIISYQIDNLTNFLNHVTRKYACRAASKTN